MITPEQIQQETTNQVRQIIGDLMIQNATLRAENEALKAELATQVAQVQELQAKPAPKPNGKGESAQTSG